MKIFRDLYNYRELLKTNVKKEIRGKYKGSFLGVLWSFVNPLLMVLVYAIVFPIILKNSEPNYIVFLITAVIPWNWFTTVVTQGSGTFLYNSNIIKKVYFPREIMPISIVTSGLVNFLISCIIILLFLIGSGIGLSWYILLLPIIVIVQYILCLAIVLVLSSVNVYIRDLEYIVNFLVMMLFYATPILYNSASITGKLAVVLKLNPMAHIINAYRSIFFFQTLPNLHVLAIIGLGSLILLFFAFKIFKKLEKGFAEEL
ncbi:MAG: ABC transporter permease [Bacilli bacterium]